MFTLSLLKLKRFLIKSTTNYTSHWIILLLDLFFLIQTFIFSYAIRYNLNFDIINSLKVVPIVLVFSALSILIVGSHRGVIRHTGEKDIFNIILSQLLIAFLLIFLTFLNRHYIKQDWILIPYSVVIIHFLLSTVCLSVIRFGYKVIYYKIRRTKDKNERVLIFGSGRTGKFTEELLKGDPRKSIKIIGFVDDDPKKIGKIIHGIRVYEAAKIDKDFIESNLIDELIIAVESLPKKRLREIVDHVGAYNIKLTKVPSVLNWNKNADFTTKQIKKIKIEDLLDRSEIEINNPKIQEEYSNKTILVSGAAGSIGSEICKQLSLYSPKQIILVDIAESPLYELQQEFVLNGFNNFKAIVGDIRDSKRLEQIFEEYKPNVVFHAAAYKHVPLMEENPYEAIRINVLGTKCLADLSIKYHVDKFVMVSTDKAVNPTNVMGATKRVAEKYVTALKNNGETSFVITRFGNVLGSNGSVIPLFKRQLENGGPLTVTHKEITRFFMTIPEACQLVLEAGAMGEDGQILIFDMGESVKINDLAKRMIQLSGYKYPEEMYIIYTGLRAGEKLYEELLNTKENTLPTYHPKIMIAKVENSDNAILKEKINNFNELLLSNDNNLMVKNIKSIVPEYLSKNSIYEKLDNLNY